mgnify:FL=1
MAKRRTINSKTIPKPTENSAVHGIGLSSHYDTDFTESSSRGGWVNYGEDNLYPDFLIGLARNSAVHSALINGISDMIYGEGLTAADKEEKPDQWLRLGMFLDTLDEDEIKKCIKDLKVFNGFYLNVIYSVDRTTFTEIYHVPFQKVRAGDNNEDGVTDSFFYSEDWANYRKKENTPIEIAAFNPENKMLYPNQLFAVKGYSVGDKTYPKPDYLGAVNYIELDKEIAIYHLNNIKNGLAPSFLINFNNGVPGIEKRNQIKQTIKKELSGTGNAGKFVMTFSDGKDRAPDMTPFPLSDADKQYIFLSEETQKKIFIGHRVTSPMLFGVKDSSGFGNNADELRTSFELFEATVVQPYQLIVLKALNKLLGEVGINLDLYFESMKPITIIKDDAPILEENEISSQQNLSSCCGSDKMNFGKEVKDESNKYIPNKEEENAALDYMKSIGEDKVEFEKDWLLIDEEEVQDEPQVDNHYSRNYSFAIQNDPDKRSYLDSGFYRIRYKYDGPAPIRTSRNFCIEMITTYKANLYRREDITAMTNSVTNKPFGRYSIFLWKGSYNCRHKWNRRTYFLRRVPKGKTITIQGKEYKGGQFLPADLMKHFKIIQPNGFTDVLGRPSFPIENPTATNFNPKVLND